MAEKKGFFGRIFGRKNKDAPEEVVETPEADDQLLVEELSEAEPQQEPASRTEEEELADLDAAHSTAPEGGEAVVLVPHEEETTEPATPEEAQAEAEITVDELTEEAHDDISHVVTPQIADEDDHLVAQTETRDEDPVSEVPPEEETAPETLEAVDPIPSQLDHDPREDISTAMVPEAAAEEIPEKEELSEPTLAEPPIEEPKKKRGLFARLKDGLSKTSAKLSSGIGDIFTKRKLDDETLEELEDLLITADLGLPATTRIITTLSKTKYDQEISDEEVREVLSDEISSTLKHLAAPLEVSPNHRPHIILMTGVNGAGKTTTIGKLAKKFSDEGQSVLLAAGDTFRAAAIEQLTVWGERVGVPVVAKEQGADAAGLAFDAIKRAQDENIDVVLIDTAGRLQNRKELMEELGKIVRVIKKLDSDAPHDTVLVLDATVGQNALSQAENFMQTAAVSGLIMTKLDGTARGGVLVALGDKFALPIHYIGVGEAVEDLQVFDAEEFATALTARGE